MGHLKRTVVLAALLAPASLVAACSSGSDGTTADCTTLVRVDDRTYLAVTMTDVPPTGPRSDGVLLACADTGGAPTGGVDGAGGTVVELRRYDDPGLRGVLTLEVGGQWQVLVDQAVDDAGRQQIAERLVAP